MFSSIVMESGSNMTGCEFTESGEVFQLHGAQRYRELYFPIANEYGLKSAVTPNMAGDAKLDQNHFLYEPVSAADPVNRRFARNFWVVSKTGEIWSAVGSSATQRAALYTDQEEEITITAGYMWHKMSLSGKLMPILSEVTIFAPVDKNMEVMKVELTNQSNEPIHFQPCVAIPLFGRSADNIRDHRHVTGLLHRVSVEHNIIELNPTLSFDERGHKQNDTRYFAYAMKSDQTMPKQFYVNQNDFIGEGGDFERPMALLMRQEGVANGYREDGQEAMGGFLFEEETLMPQETVSYIIYVGTAYTENEIESMIAQLPDQNAVDLELERTKQYWQNKVNVRCATGNVKFDRYMDWVSFQPELRRLYGCSFLPHHDYGKGGRGWRDLWQDCLALLLMNPSGVRQMLLSNFAGVRIDGTNATIIGEHQGSFIADRNSITRVWMDHGVWPLKTTKLYIDQTGDLEILNQEVNYFKDRQVMRGTDIDSMWDPNCTWLKDTREKEYKGSVLEHLILQNLTAFWEVGMHNHIKLRDADWNDALDMAGEKGESVAFSNAYAQNLLELAELVKALGEISPEVMLLQEMQELLQDDCDLYENPEEKNRLLNEYSQNVKHHVSGIRVMVSTDALAESLKAKGRWMLEHIRKTQWVIDPQGGGFFRGYYDNDGQPLDGIVNQSAQLMLTGQVFSIMGGTATDEMVSHICESADRYLFDRDCGGYRLNTDFKEIKTNMGRMFGFAYGEKENGAVFSHMAVMYANALYSRGFVKEGYRALKALYDQSMNFETSHIYPGIPEYFGRGGRGLYAYLTGAASWYLLTVMNQMFGIRGLLGNLVIEPKLLKEQFDQKQEVGMNLRFAGYDWQILYENPRNAEYGNYRIHAAFLDGKPIEIRENQCVLPLTEIKKLDENQVHKIKIVLQ